MREDACSGFDRYQAKAQPRCNCYPCWEKFFKTQVARTYTALKAIKTFGQEAVEKVQGTKFVKFLLEFDQREQERGVNILG